MNIKKHYSDLASIYDDLWFYSDEFVTFMAKEIVSYLSLTKDEEFLDLGAGTGIYSKKIAELIGSNDHIFCVDYSEEMLKQCRESSQLKCECADAVEFTSRGNKFNKILIKEMIHHIDDKKQLFRNIFNSLDKDGQFLLLLLPPTIEYPLFKAAIDYYETVQPHYSSLVEMMDEVGFKSKVDIVGFPLVIEKEKYINMVEKRYMSLLSNFSDDEITAGAKEIRDNYKENILCFKDNFVFIKAVK